MKKLRFFLLFGLSMCIAPTIRAQTAEEMASNCKEVVQAPVINGQITFKTPDFETGFCWGAFTSLHQAAYATGSDDKPVFRICFPNTASTSEAVKVFLAYLDKHPEKLHEDYFLIAVIANQAAFPCKSAP